MRAISCGWLIVLSACATGAETGEVLRVVTYNIHGGGPVAEGPEARAALQAARSGRAMAEFLAAELLALDAEVIALQEVPNERFADDLASHLGMHHAFFPGGWRGKGWPDGIAAAIFSEYPIVEATSCPLSLHDERPEDLFTRGYGKAVLSMLGEPLAVYVAHMLPAWKNTTHIREGELREIGASAQRDLESGRSVLVLGDMNHRPSMPEYRLWGEHGLIDAVASKGSGVQRTCPSNGPTERIDYVFVAGPLAARLQAATVLTKGRWQVVDGTSGSFALSDHLPVMATFR